MDCATTELPWTARGTLAVGCLIASISLAACGSSATKGSGASSTSVASAKLATILSEPVEPTTFAQARAAVLAVYRSRPGIAKFSVRDVEYTSKTRDKVLGVCHQGGAERSASALESARVLACAPLIFFYYRYGRDASVPQAVEVARTLYWYAVTANRQPVDAGPGLTRLLTSWGVS